MSKSKNSQPQTVDKFSLSHELCDNTFKNVLRGQSSEVIFSQIF
jgi:hypothetical protein